MRYRRARAGNVVSAEEGFRKALAIEPDDGFLAVPVAEQLLEHDAGLEAGQVLELRGAVAFVRKHVDPRDLPSVLRQALDGTPLARASRCASWRAFTCSS